MNLTTWAPPQAPHAAMTYRVYVRWPQQRTTNKTTTDSEVVAQTAFDELRATPDLARRGALGIAMTKDNRQIHYLSFEPDPKSRQ